MEDQPKLVCREAIDYVDRRLVAQGPASCQQARAGGPDLILVAALALSNLPEALSATAGMRLASRSSTYVLSLWSGIALGTAAATALAFYFLSDLGPHATAILKAYGAGALIAMAAETMIPEAFHNGPRYSGLLAAAGFAALILFGELAR